MARAAVATMLAAVTVAVAVPASGAGPSPLDPTFGSGGVATIPGSDRYESQGAPLVAADGRIAVAGLVKNSSDRIFLGGLTASGATDPGFGSSGIVNTSTKASERRAATARLTDGKLLVAGRSDSGKLQLERFTPEGARDTSFGSNGTLAVTIAGGHSVPVALTTSGNSTFVALTHASPSSRKGFTVAKLTTTGLDSSFGSGGVAHMSFGSTFGQAFDVALTGSGKILMTGSLGQLGTTGSNTKLVRLLPSGARDNSFDGDGLHQIDATQANRADHGVAVIPVGDSMYVVSAADGKTAVAKLASSGALDTSFAGDGIAQGLAPSGAGFVPADAVRDAQGRIVVAGESLAGSNTSWALLRTLGQGASPLDTGFGSQGYAVLEECRNTAGNGPSGLTSPDPDTLLVAGSCGQAGAVAVARLSQALPTVPLDASLQISPEAAAAGHERINVGNLDPSAVVGQGQSLQGAALRRTALRRTALRRTALRRTALRRTALRRTALDSTLLSEIPLVGTTWQELLGADVPLQTLTFDDAFQINPEGVGNLTLDDIDPEATALRRTSLASLVLGTRPLVSLPEPSGGWCAFIAAQPYNCSNGADPSSSTLFDLEIGGDDLSGYYETPIALTAIDLGAGDDRAPLADYRLAEMDMNVRPFRETRAADVQSILACAPGCSGTLADLSPAELGDATVGELVALLPVASLDELSVGEALAALVPASEIPYELTNEVRLLDEAEFRDESLQSFVVTFSVDCGGRGGLRAVLELAGDARPVPGSATLAVGAGPPAPLDDPSDDDEGNPVYDIESACASRSGATSGELRFDVEAGSVLGFGTSTIRIESDFGDAEGDGISQVDDSRDPGDELEQSLPLTTEEIRTGHIASDTDIDTFAFTGVPGETTISLAHLPADFDLAVLGPDLGPPATALRRTALRRTDLSATALPDASGEPTDPGVLAPDTVEDLALRRTALRRTALRRTSLNRGTADEAATFEIRPEEAGETFYAQVIGYNGASHSEPYVIRRVDRPAEPPRECPSRSLGSSLQTPFPAAVPENTQALYLVHPGRMAARDGAAATQAMMTRLEVLAGNTNGVVVPVGDDPQVDTDAGFTALDANPCSAARNNRVVADVNAVVDHVREMGNGLPELRSIVIVGPDEVLPQGRVPDHTEVANEDEYAEDAAFDSDGDGDLDDNSVSGSLRDGYVLSDDPYGDFDPGQRLWVPDVALGRLVETPDQIRGQIDDFLDSDGVLDPGRAFVTGYDFITDGATAQRDALAARVGDPATQSRIDETWTAGDAAAGLAAPGAGFLAVNAHYDHFRLLPAAAFNGSVPDLLSARQTAPPAGSAIFTIGCHSGLNLAIAGTGGNPDPKLGDWAEEMTAQRGSVYAANTGYGYGDSEAVAYSERLMAEYAAHLAAGDVTTGQALMFAKQATSANIGVYDDYWHKAAMEATFYGLPMYRIGDDGGVGAPALPPVPDGPGGPGERSSTELDFPDLGDRLNMVDTDRGTYWQVDDEEPLVVQHRPIQPKTTEDVTLEGEGEARAFLFEELTTRDFRPVDPVIATPTIDTSEHEPEPEADSPLFPARLATVAPEATPEGRRETLTLVAGAFRQDTQRLMSSAGGRVLRSTSDDFEPPTIRRVDGQVNGSAFSVRVEVDGDDALGGNVLYLTDADLAAGGELTWHRAELSTISNGVLGTGGVLPSGTRVEEALVQVYDTSYNLAVSNNKVDGHTFTPPSGTGAETPRVVLEPGLPPSGYYSSGAPTVSLETGPEHADAIFEYSVDGDAFQRYAGPFQLEGDTEGEHLVEFRGSDDSSASQRFAVDTQPPTILADLDRTPNGDGWHNGPVTVSFRCADAVSGVEDCPEPVTLTDGSGQSVSGTATDGAGHTASVTVSDINIDTAAPGTSATVQGAPNAAGWFRNPVDVVFECSDALSGLASCGDVPVSGAPASATRTVAVTAEGRDQTITRDAADVAGNTATASVSDLDIDLTDPTVAITTPSSIIVGPNQRLRGTAFDATSGIASIRVRYTSLLGRVVERNADAINCAASGSCTWTAPLPGTGIWKARVTATDSAGRTGTTTGPFTIRID